MPRRAPFIVIEGLDRSGKTTQTSLLVAHLEASDVPVKLMKFPANRWELSSQIESTISPTPNSSSADAAKPTLVVADRYSFSGIAFSASKSLSYEWCLSPEIALPSPDLVIFLDISPDAARARGGYGEERYEKEEMQKKVREVFKRIGEDVNREDDREGRKGRWVVVDAGRSREEVEQDIWRLVEPIKDGLEEPLGRLWVDKLPSS